MSTNRERDRGRLDALRSRPEFRGPIDTPRPGATSEHLALIYETAAQQFSVAIPFIEHGLDRGERCLYVADRNDRDDVVDAMLDNGIDVDEAIEDGSLRIRSTEDAYRSNGAFDPDEALSFYADAIEGATAEYEALRVTAETAWIAAEGTAVEEVMEYEARVNELLEGADAIGLCQYDRERFADETIRDVVRTHPHIVFEETVVRNPSYVSPEEFLDGDRNENWDPDRRLETLLDITDTALDRREHAEFLHDLQSATTRSDRSFEDRLRTVFDLGCDRFDLELGVLARIGDDDRIIVEYTNGDHDYFEPGATLPLSAPEPATVESGIEGERSGAITVYPEFGPQVPLGTVVEVEGDDDRILFFLASKPDSEPFSAAERRFHEWLGNWLKAEFERRRRTVRLEEVNQCYRVAREISQAIVEERTRSRIEQAVCDRLVAAGPYVAAWIADRPVDAQRPTPRAWAGIREETVRSIARADSGDESELLRQTFESEQPESIPIADEESLHPHVRERGMESALAVPLSYGETCYGALVAYADRANGFADRHRTALESIGTLVGFAIVATERKEMLVADEVVELEIRVRNSDHFLLDVTATVDVAFTLEDLLSRSDEPYLVYVTANDPPVSEVLERAERSPNVERARLVDRQDDDALFEFVFDGLTVLETFAEYGGTVTDATAKDGEGIVTVKFPRTANVRVIVDAFRETFPDSEVVTKRTCDHPAASDRLFQHAVTDRLTEKQREALRAAYFGGYFERPRRTSGNELADVLDICSSTLHQHLQAGLRKLLTVTFDDRN